MEVQSALRRLLPPSRFWPRFPSCGSRQAVRVLSCCPPFMSDGEELFFQVAGFEDALLGPVRTMAAAQAAARAAKLTVTGKPDQRKLGHKRLPRSGDLLSPSKVARWRHNPMHSKWWSNYFDRLDNFEEASFWGKKFRRRFRVPRVIFEELLVAAQEWPEFCDTDGKHGRQRRAPCPGADPRLGPATLRPLSLVD